MVIPVFQCSTFDFRLKSWYQFVHWLMFWFERKEGNNEVSDYGFPQALMLKNSIMTNVNYYYLLNECIWNYCCRLIFNHVICSSCWMDVTMLTCILILILVLYIRC